jgi:two-component system, NarL family, nitrate/nitrite response regulator NarL
MDSLTALLPLPTTHVAPLIGVGLLADHCIVQDHLRKVFESDGLRVTLASDEPSSFLRQLDDATSVAVIDLCHQRPPREARDARVRFLGELRRQCPALPTLVLSNDHRRRQAWLLYRAGATGVLSAHLASNRVLLESVRALSRGERVSLLEAIAYPVQPEPGRDELETLTNRERSVLVQVASGSDNLKIAAMLGISEHTVKAHMVAIYRKVSTRNRVKLALIARNLGLVAST